VCFFSFSFFVVYAFEHARIPFLCLWFAALAFRPRPVVQLMAPANPVAVTRKDFDTILSKLAVAEVTKTLESGTHSTVDQMVRVNSLSDEALNKILRLLSTLEGRRNFWWPKCVALLQPSCHSVLSGKAAHKRVDVYTIVKLFKAQMQQSKLDLLTSHITQVFPDLLSEFDQREPILLTALFIGRDPDLFSLASVSTAVAFVGILNKWNKARLRQILSDLSAISETIKLVNSVPLEALQEALARLFQCPDLQTIWPGFVEQLGDPSSEEVSSLIRDFFCDILEEPLNHICFSFTNAFPGERDDEQNLNNGLFITSLLIGMSWNPPVSPASTAAPGAQLKMQYIRIRAVLRENAVHKDMSCT
jgi:hypothetical protein